MKILVWRLFKKGWVVQVALTILLASAVALFAIYNAYIARESNVMSGRMKNVNPAGYYLVTDNSLPQNRSGFSSQGRIVTFVASWFEAVTPSNYGHLPITYLDLTNGNLGLAPQTNAAAVHENIAARLGLSKGDELLLYRGGDTLRVIVTDVYSEKPFSSEIDFGESILVRTGERQENKYFLYRQIPGGAARDAQARAALAGLHGRGSAIRSLEEADPMASLFVGSSYNVIVQAKLTLLVFLALAFLTAKLLSYMDSRRILAILKTLGLRKNQVAATVAGESLIAPLFGSLFGGISSVILLGVVNGLGMTLPVSSATIVVSMLIIFPAVALGVFVPARLAQVSTVNELLFERPAAMIRDRTDTARQRYPAMDGFAARGVNILKLETVQGHFDGFIFRRLGDRVQAGEVIALQQSWWGMKTKEYASPIDGVIVYFEAYTGMIGIALQAMSDGEIASARG